MISRRYKVGWEDGKRVKLMLWEVWQGSTNGDIFGDPGGSKEIPHHKLGQAYAKTFIEACSIVTLGGSYLTESGEPRDWLGRLYPTAARAVGRRVAFTTKHDFVSTCEKLASGILEMAERDPADVYLPSILEELAREALEHVKKHRTSR